VWPRAGTAAPHSHPSSPSSSWPAVRRSYSTCSTAAPGQLSGVPTFRVCSTTAAQLLLVSCLSLLIHLEHSCPCPAVRRSSSRCCTAAPGQPSGAPNFHVAQLQLSGALTPRVAQLSFSQPSGSFFMAWCWEARHDIHARQLIKDNSSHVLPYLLYYQEDASSLGFKSCFTFDAGP
jgi:hypothetical protein